MALVVMFSSASAQTGSLKAWFNDDTFSTFCHGEITEGTSCYLLVGVTNTSDHAQTWTLDEVGMGGAFDAAQVLPGWPEGKTLGDCPCQYTIPARSVIVVHLLIKLGKLDGGTHSSSGVRAQLPTPLPNR